MSGMEQRERVCSFVSIRPYGEAFETKGAEQRNGKLGRGDLDWIFFYHLKPL